MFFAGVEGDIGYLGIDHTFKEWLDPTFVQKTDWYGTLRGRLGTSTGPALLYFTGGGAFVHVKNGFTYQFGTDISSRVASGWAFGGGTEVALNDRWSAKLEYLYLDVGNAYHAAGGLDADFKSRFQIVRAGLNYSFNSAN